jgi:hypothetical protein
VAADIEGMRIETEPDEPVLWALRRCNGSRPLTTSERHLVARKPAAAFQPTPTGQNERSVLAPTDTKRGWRRRGACGWFTAMGSDADGCAALSGEPGLPELLRKEDVARILTVSTRTVERLIASGEFSGGVVRKQGIVRITRPALEAFVARYLRAE